MQKKAFDKVQHPFTIKNLRKVAVEGAHLSIVKAVHDSPTANIRVSGRKPKHLLKNQEQDRVSAFTTLTQRSAGSPASAVRQEEEIKGIPVGKEEVKLSLFTDDMLLYMENPKDSAKKLLEMIN